MIEWKYIVELYEYQKLHGFRLANKLTKQHVMFEKNQMKVKLAVQVLSKSVANALITMSEMKIEKFENYKLQYIDHANMIKEELDNYIKYINDNEIDENINYNNIINDNESEVDLEIEIEDSISESSE